MPDVFRELGGAVATVWGRAVAMSVDTWASMFVAIGTLVLALMTYRTVQASWRQLRWSKKRDREARIPRLFVKDVWIDGEPSEVQSQSGPRLYVKLATKNIANLGSHAIAIHKMCIVDERANALVWAYPMTVVPPGKAWRENDGTHHFVTATSPRNEYIAVGALDARASHLVVEFRSGADQGKAWAMVMPRVEHAQASRWATFAGQEAKPQPVNTLTLELQETLAEPDRSRRVYAAAPTSSESVGTSRGRARSKK